MTPKTSLILRQALLGCVIALLAGAFSACIADSGHPTANGAGASGGNLVIATSGGGGAGNGGGAGSASGTSGGSTGGDTGICMSSADCAPPHPYCASGSCVECQSATNCAMAAGKFCQLTNHACVQCLSDNNCAGNTPYCSPDGACVQCLSTKNCGVSGVTCDLTAYRCRASCTASSDCPSDSGRPYCDLTRAACVECVLDDQCPAIKPRCDLLQDACVACLTDMDCTDATLPHCDSKKSETCVQCVANTDCATNQVCQANKCVVNPN